MNENQNQNADLNAARHSLDRMVRPRWTVAIGMACAGFFFGQIPHCQETWRAVVMLMACAVFAAMAFVPIREAA